MTLIRPADMAEVGAMNAHQRIAAALIRTVPTGRLVAWSAGGAVQSRNLRQPMPLIPDGFLTTERITVRNPETPTKTADASMHRMSPLTHRARSSPQTADKQVGLGLTPNVVANKLAAQPNRSFKG